MLQLRCNHLYLDPHLYRLMSPHTSVNVKFMDTFQGNETKTIDVDGDKGKSPSNLNTIAVEHNYSKNPVEIPHAWVKFGSLSSQHWKGIK